MKPEELRTETLSRALDVYLEVAYGTASGARDRPDRDLAADAAPEEILGLFQNCETEIDGRTSASYALRLGNRNYPFMKLVLQEHIVHGELFFGVDTHDDMNIDPDYPDYDDWMQLRAFNRQLKQEIESRFALAGLPTAATIRDICERRSAEPPQVRRHGTLLVVDDEEDLAAAVEALLRARGFEVHVAADGRQALDRLQELRPDLVVLDYEMPVMDGLEVLTCMKQDERTEDIPVLLTTASKIGYGEMRRADGFLAKPYQEQLLYDMVDRLLEDGHEGSDPSDRGVSGGAT